MTAILGVRDISKQFAGRHAVERLSFEVRPGEVFALLGPNGAGKTTTVRMLAGIIRPDEGTIEAVLDGATHASLPPPFGMLRGLPRWTWCAS